VDFAQVGIEQPSDHRSEWHVGDAALENEGV
jgi:hypothetical protein